MIRRTSLSKFLLYAGLLFVTSFSNAFAQNQLERNQLQMLLRQIDQMQATSKDQSISTNSRANRNRYYFDYQRLNADLNRIKRGINDYLQPKRAQPRDPVELSGDYRREAGQGDAS